MTAGYAAHTALKARLEAGLGGVLCECNYPARLSPSALFWQCVTGKCNFLVSVAETNSVPKREFALRKVRGESEPLDAGLKPQSDPRSGEHMAAIRQEEKQQRRVGEAMEQCGWTSEMLDETQQAVFPGFVAWFDSMFESGLCDTEVNRLMPRYLETLEPVAA